MDLVVKVDKGRLRYKITQYKERYTDTFKTLLEIFEIKSQEFQEKFKKYSQKVVEGSLTPDDEEPVPPMTPTDRTEMYDLYLDMLDQHINSFIDIDELLFKRLWKDDWDFIRHHIRTLTSWSSSSSTEISAMADEALLAYMG